MFDLSETSLISFEISTKCNMKKIHKECPINYRISKDKGKTLDVFSISKNIRDAKKMKFNGYFAFHVFNEPLLDLSVINMIIDQNPNEKYLLWTNGVLLCREIEKNQFLRRFKLVCITCYEKKQMHFYEKLKEYYGNIQIFSGDMDDRTEAYTRNHDNYFSCKKPLFEMPIDYYGNILLCTFDYNNTHCIGNVFESDLKSIINSERYQQILRQAHGRLLDRSTCPHICKRCSEPWVTYPHYFEERR